jgi:uncharacterized protein YggE
MSDRQGNHYLSVTGVGRVQVEPDEAVVQLGVVTEAGTAAEAVASNARQTQAVLDAVSAQPNHGITTSGLSVSPIISYEPNSSVSKIVGFRATNSVEVTTKIGYVGQIYDAGITAGANESSGITFRVRDEGPQRKEALRLAVEQAFDEAKLVAAAADIDLRGVDSIQVEPAESRVFFRSEALAKDSGTPVIPGRQTITARVQVQFNTGRHLEVQPGKMERDTKQQPSARRPGSA